MTSTLEPFFKYVRIMPMWDSNWLKQDHFEQKPSWYDSLKRLFSKFSRGNISRLWSKKANVQLDPIKIEIVLFCIRNQKNQIINNNYHIVNPWTQFFWKSPISWQHSRSFILCFVFKQKLNMHKDMHKNIQNCYY